MRLRTIFAAVVLASSSSVATAAPALALPALNGLPALSGIPAVSSIPGFAGLLQTGLSLGSAGLTPVLAPLSNLNVGALPGLPPLPGLPALPGLPNGGDSDLGLIPSLASMAPALPALPAVQLPDLLKAPGVAEGLHLLAPVFIAVPVPVVTPLAPNF